MRAHVAFDADALTNDVRGTGQDFGEVSSCFLLHQNGSDEELQVLGWDAGSHLQQSIAELEAQPLLLIDLDEFKGEWLRRLLRDDFDGRAHRMTGEQRAGHEVNGLRQSCVEELETPVALNPEQDAGGTSTGYGCGSGEERNVKTQETGQPKAGRAAHAGENGASHTHAAAGMSEERLEFH